MTFDGQTLLSGSNLLGTPSTNKHPSRYKGPLSFHLHEHSTIQVLRKDNHLVLVIVGRLEQLKLLSVVTLDRKFISDLHEVA